MRNPEKDHTSFDSPQRETPFPFWEQACREAPALYSGALRTWVVTRYADIDRTLPAPQHVCNRFPGGQGLNVLEPEVVALLEGLPAAASPRPPPKKLTMQGVGLHCRQGVSVWLPLTYRGVLDHQACEPSRFAVKLDPSRGHLNDGDPRESHLRSHGVGGPTQREG